MVINILLPYYCVYLLKSKDEEIKKFVFYKNKVENQVNKKIKMLRSDRGGEYESPFVDVCAPHRIIHLNPMEWLSERIAL